MLPNGVGEEEVKEIVLSPEEHEAYNQYKEAL